MFNFKPTKNFPLVLLVSFLLIFLYNTRIKIFNLLRAPLRLMAGSYYALQDIARYKQVMMENKILRENIDNLEGEILKLEDARLENQRLHALLGFTEKKQDKFIPAMVIARDFSGFSDTIIIDKGKKQGVQKGMTVISGNGFVGRVRETGSSISSVLLISDRNSVVSGIVQSTRDEGAVEGRMRSGIVLKYLDLDSDVKEGDKVITAKGILIGRIASIAVDDSALYMNATIEPEVDMGKLEEVLVIR